MMDHLYFPIIKTRDAEMKAISKLSYNVKDKILPIFELTKSRRTKNVPDGDIHKKMAEIKNSMGERPFILDLSINKNYTNPQIETLLSPENGYYEWVYFLKSYNHLNIIPMVHLYDDEDFTDVEAFVSSPYIKDKNLAVRIPFDENNINKFITPITRRMLGNTLYVIIDMGQVKGDHIELIECVEDRIKEIQKVKYPSIKIIICSTSFPKSVAEYGINEGSFPIYEELIYKKLKKNNEIYYGDYASINIEQIEMRGGSFIPRIDISLDETFFYERHKRSEGSYTLCAQKIKNSKKYIDLKTWADEEIKSASINIPSGISPSFWIAVRMNYFMTKRVSKRELEEL